MNTVKNRGILAFLMAAIILLGGPGVMAADPTMLTFTDVSTLATGVVTAVTALLITAVTLALSWYGFKVGAKLFKKVLSMVHG